MTLYAIEPLAINSQPRIFLELAQLFTQSSFVLFLQELYQKYIDGDEGYKNIKQDDDPFYDPTEDVMVGSANVFLQSLSYALDFDDKLVITDYKVDHSFFA